MEFDQAVLVRAEFSGAPLEKFRFIHCAWPRHQDMKTIYEARRTESGGRKQGFVRLDEPSMVGVFESPPDPEKLADTFRRLKKIAVLEQDQALASDWHHWEKEMLRLSCAGGLGDFRPGQKTWWSCLGRLLVLQIYKASSGYGENPGRAALVLLGLIAAPFLGLGLWGAPAHPEYYLPLLAPAPPAGLDLGYKALHKICQLIITLQAGFFGLAMRNRFRR